MAYHIYNEGHYFDFVSEVDDFIKKLGITEWEYTVSQEQLESGVSATVNLDCVTKKAIFRLTEIVEFDYGVELDVSKLAKHEVLHLLFADFCWIAANEKDFSSKPVVACEHGVINRLLKLL